ncbi:MAG: SUF system NifU family Fe-S cluster assembly protein [Acholeplasmatales bacterium]|nr:SUF system NifU family Fe-S cluster assembly protein [Acholeplasmatales bacterium]
MQDLNNLYRAVIMDNYKNPHNKGLVENPKYHFLHLNNPSCGDDMNVQLYIEDGKIVDARHDGHGCSICCSSASVMTETIKGKPVEEALKLIEDFYLLVSGKELSDEEQESLGEAMAYTGVRQFPARIKCASLSWKCAERILRGDANESK